MTKLLTIYEAAEHVGLPVETLRQWRYKGTGPQSGKLGRRIFYRQADLDAWVDAQFKSA